MGRWGGVAAMALAALSSSGCGGDEESPAPAVCADGHTIGGTCAGVPAEPLCSSDVCTDGVGCSATIEARDTAGLTAALAKASAGSCIALGPGDYGDVTLPGGVSLLGRGAAFVRVAHVVVGAGKDTVVRGVAVSGGVELSGATGARLDSVRIAGSSKDGIDVGEGDSVAIVSSEILDAGRYGVRAFDTGAVSVERSIISGSRGPGLWAQCAKGCDCPASPDVHLDAVIVKNSKLVGVSLVGAKATLADVEIADNALSMDFQPSGGMAVSSCSTIDAVRLHVHDNSYYGVFIDHSAATLGGPDTKNGFEIDHNRFGLWIESPDEDKPIQLYNGLLEGNRGVGVGFTGGTKGIIIYDFQVRKTQFEAMPVLSGGLDVGSQFVCDAVSWQKGAQATIEGLTLSGNDVPEETPDPSLPPPAPRASVLIDGAVGAGSSLARVHLEGGDESRKVVQQSLPAGGATPKIGDDVPPIAQSDKELFSVPAAPAGPAAL